MDRGNVWLSIDWDYFVNENETWDFGHAELPVFNDILWNIRVAQFAGLGQDLLEATSLRRAEPHPQAFWKRLKQLGYRFDNVQAVVIGDSHQWAYNVFRRASREGPPLSETRIVHFDAHHDLTYNMLRFEQEAAEERVTCENWLLMTHLRQMNLESLIVYPPWKGLRDWDRSFGKYPEVLRSLARYTQPCVWPDPRVAEAAGEVELVYLCRSSAWTPPWHDEAFSQFAYELQDLTKVPLMTPFVEAEKIDPLSPRPFDLKQAKQTLETEKVFLARMHGNA